MSVCMCLSVCPADMRAEWTFAPILSRQRREIDFLESRRNQFWNQNLELSEVVKLYLGGSKNDHFLIISVFFMFGSEIWNFQR